MSISTLAQHSSSRHHSVWTRQLADNDEAAKMELAKAIVDCKMECVTDDNPLSVADRKRLIKKYRTFVRDAIVDKYVMVKKRTYEDYNYADPEKCEKCLKIIPIYEKFRILPCGHRFCNKCADHWFINEALNCPKCQTPVKHGLRYDFFNVDNQVLNNAIARIHTPALQEQSLDGYKNNQSGWF